MTTLSGRQQLCLFGGFILLLVPLFGVHAQEDPLGRTSKSPQSFLGMTLEEAYQTLGPPTGVFSHRGGLPHEDDVVFFYSNYFYLFWFKDRVWQLRWDKRSTSTVLDLEMGMSWKSVLETMKGEPLKREEGKSLIYNVPSESFSIRISLFFSEGRLTDLYLYRSDY